MKTIGFLVIKQLVYHEETTVSSLGNEIVIYKEGKEPALKSQL